MAFLWNRLERRDLFLCAVTFCVIVILWQMGLIAKLFNSEKLIQGREGYQEEAVVEIKSNNIRSVDIQELDQKDKRLWYYVRSHHIFLPSVLEYSFGRNKKLGMLDPEVDQVVYPLFKKKREGFFVEVGAYDGLSSHTLILEKDFGWNGLLIECNPELLPKLKSVNRKAYIADVCLSTVNHPVKASMTSMDKWLASSSLGSGNLYPNIPSNFTKFEVQTIPLYSILASIDVKEVDLLVLDVQSLELEVLKNFPFESVLVKVWVVETYFYSVDQKSWLVNYMSSKGYPPDKVKKLTNDFVFVHNSLE